MTRENLVHNLFLEHPQKCGERYFTHLLFTLKTAAYLFTTAFIVIIHGLLPCLHETTASTRIKQLNDRLQKRIMPPTTP